MEYIALILSVLALFLATRMSSKQRSEYVFFLREHEPKLGAKPGILAKLKCWNAALGGRAPKWHWIPPVSAPLIKQ